MTLIKEAQRRQAKEQLQKWLQPGDVLYCILRHVSRSGMSRVVQLVKPVVDQDGHPDLLVLGSQVARCLGLRFSSQHEGVVMRGAGMDMGFALVYDLARELFDDGYALKHRWL